MPDPAADCHPITATPIPLDALTSLGLRAQAAAWAEHATDLEAYTLHQPGWAERGEVLIHPLWDRAGVSLGSDPEWLDAGSLEAVIAWITA